MVVQDLGQGHVPGHPEELYETAGAKGGIVILKTVIPPSLPGVATASTREIVIEAEAEEEARVGAKEDKENKISKTTRKGKRELKG